MTARKILLDKRIIFQDHSWVHGDIATEKNPSRTDSYAPNYKVRPGQKEDFEVWFPSEYSIIEGAIANLKAIPKELDYDPDHLCKIHIDKKGLLAAARKGEIPALEFAEACSLFRKYPTLEKSAKIGEDNDHRVYTPPALVSKRIYPYILNENNEPMGECFDISNCWLLSLTLYLAANHTFSYSTMSGVTDKDFCKAVELIYGHRYVKIDGNPVRVGYGVYGMCLNYMENTGWKYLFGKKSKTMAEKIDAVKKGMNATIMSTNEMFARWEKKALEGRVSNKIKIRLLIREFLRSNFKRLWDQIEQMPTVEKKSREYKTPCFWAVTQGERTLMDCLYTYLKYQKIYNGLLIRKHDGFLGFGNPMSKYDQDRIIHKFLVEVVPEPGCTDTSSTCCKQIWDTFYKGRIYHGN